MSDRWAIMHKLPDGSLVCSGNFGTLKQLLPLYNFLDGKRFVLRNEKTGEVINPRPSPPLG